MIETMRKVAALVFLVLGSTQLIGQSGNDTPLIHTILFKITSHDSTRASYLFGTHHAFGKSFFDSLTIANQALEACDLLILENVQTLGRTTEEIINRRKTKTDWNKLLSKKDLAFVQKLFAKSPTDYRKMTPTEMYAFLNRYFKQEVCLTKSLEDTSLSLDGYIGSRAIEQNTLLQGLESAEEQIALMNKDVEGMPRKIHKRRLANSINQIRSENSTYCEETDWYATMEIDYQFDKPCRNALMLTDRNNKWIEIITEELKSNSCFIAVGLSHLMYECGLINQLKGLGYTITPIIVD